MTKVLLYSGGMDSWLIDKLWKPDIKLFIDIGTNNNKEEFKRLPKDVIIKKIELSEFEEKDNDYFLPMRNLFFVCMASYYGDEICLGATQESAHFDNNNTFLNLSTNLINYLYSEQSNKKVKIVTPYQKMKKEEMLQEYVNNGGSAKDAWEQSFSCFNPTKEGEPCFKCSSCITKIKAFKNIGYNFINTDEVLEKGE